MIEKYKSLTRTSLAEIDNLPHCGVYILAYMGRILYVGKTSYDVAHRLVNHWNHRATELLGDWMDKVRLDWANVALDVLEPPDDVRNVNYWLRQVESALVCKLNPLFNEQLMSVND